MQVLYIAQRELKGFFTSATAYIVITLFLLIAGGLFWMDFFQPVATELTLRRFFSQAPFFMCFFAPAVTMRLLAEEKRSGTLEMLMTLPVRDSEVVLGKFLGALGLIAVVLIATVSYPLTLGSLGTLDSGPIIGGYIGLLLLSAAYVGLGVMVSSWTKDQVVAILVSFFLCFALYSFGGLSMNLDPGPLKELLWTLSSGAHFENVARGILDLRDVLYYVAVAGFGLTVATVTLSARRW